MKLFTKFAGASALVMASVMPAQADVVLDSFNYTTAPFGGSVVDFSVTNQSPTDGTYYSVVGAATDYEFSGSLPSFGFNPNAASNSSQLFASWPSGLTGQPSALTVSYDGTAFGGIDFESFGSAFQIEVLELNLDTVDSGFVVSVDLFDGVNSATISLPINFTVDAILDPPRLFTVKFSDFTADPGFNWNSVLTADVEYAVDNGNVDFRLGSIGIVPEPATLGVLGLGLMGLGLRRRKAAK